MAAFHVATRFMTFLSASRVDAAIGNFIRARGLGVVNGLDMEHTGTVDKILTGSIERLLREGMAPILPCIGYSPAGKPYNVPSDGIALAVSSALGAVKLFIVSLSGGLSAEKLRIPPGIEVGENGRIIQLRPAEAEAVLEANSNAESGNRDESSAAQLRELHLALRASRAGVERVHIISGREEGSVLRELFSNLGSGTMIYADEYESIRPLHNRDIPDVLRLMEPLMQKDILVRRTAEQIQEKKGDYVVFEIDSSVHACGALHDWGEGQAEIAAIATDPLYADMGLGRRIVGCLKERAEKLGFRRVFALTTTTHDWFEFLGFRETAVETLPERKRRVYNQNRKSKVFALNL
jgi:amino-acid N-acetyltransferase